MSESIFKIIVRGWELMDYEERVIDRGNVNFDLRSTNCINVYLVVDGEIYIEKLKESVVYKKGDVFSVFEYENCFCKKNDAIVVCISINKQSYRRFSFVKSAKPKNFNNNDIVKAFVSVLKSIKEEDFFTADLYVVTLINYLNYRVNTTSDFKGKPSQTDDLIINVVEYINSNYKNNLNLTQISSEFYVNPSYLSRQFSKKMNISLTRYIKKVRIYNVSRALVLNGSIKTSWRNFGYTNYNTYLNDFKDIMKVSPTKFIEDKEIGTIKEERSNDILDIIDKLDNIIL